MLARNFTTCEIPLENGGFAFADTADASFLSKFKWFSKKFVSGHEYAIARTKIDGKWRQLAMHRYLLGLAFGDPRMGDHIDGVGLNNRRSNLRICTPAQNCANRRVSAKSSGYKGVFAQHGKYIARIGSSREKTYIGIFESKHQAAAAYNKCARERFGEFASLNVIDASAYRIDLERSISACQASLAELVAELAGIG